MLVARSTLHVGGSISKTSVKANNTAHSVTERVGHCKEIVKDLNISEWDAIVTFSGDGLIYEAINGLCSRPDALKALRECPIGVLPSGKLHLIQHNSGVGAEDFERVWKRSFVFVERAKTWSQLDKRDHYCNQRYFCFHAIERKLNQAQAVRRSWTYAPLLKAWSDRSPSAHKLTV